MRPKFQRIPRRQFLGGALGLLAAGRACPAGEGGDKAGAAGFMERPWRLDPVCVLPRGPQGSYDARVVGDPCIVWDEKRGTWRMFYFASGHGSGTALAFSRSQEQIGPGDWEKAGQPELTNPEDLVARRNWHKWWVVMDLERNNRAARIEGRYWALMVSARQQQGQRERKHIQVAYATSLAGPWTIVPQPILAPDPDFLDGLHCDTPSAFWMAQQQQRVAIFYKGYPSVAQEPQSGSRFGSGTILAYWHPRDVTARKVRVLLRSGVNDTWLKGWISTPQPEAPSSKHQIPNKFKRKENTKFKTGRAPSVVLVIGILDFGFVWDLEFGAWNFLRRGGRLGRQLLAAPPARYPQGPGPHLLQLRPLRPRTDVLSNGRAVTEPWNIGMME